jgi:hypothetical protein
MCRASELLTALLHLSFKRLNETFLQHPLVNDREAETYHLSIPLNEGSCVGCSCGRWGLGRQCVRLRAAVKLS